MPTTKVDNGRVSINYELFGEGDQKVLFVMGLGASGYAWLPNVQWLAQNHPEYQSCIFDNRGIGKSDVPKGRYTTTMMAKDALDLVDFLGWHKFHLVGISMGGMISQEITLLAKDRILSLCLGVTHSGGPGSFPPIAGSLGVMKNMSKKTIEDRAPGTVDILFSKKYLAIINEDGKSNRDLQIERIIELGKLIPPPDKKGMRSQLLAVQTHSVGRRRLDMIKARQFPLQIITGTDDLLVNPKASFFLRDALKADDFVLFDGCGHGINSERFDEYNEALVRNFRAGWNKLESQSEPVLHHPQSQQPLHMNNNNNNDNQENNQNNFNDYNDYNEVESKYNTVSAPNVKLDEEYESSAY